MTQLKLQAQHQLFLMLQIMTHLVARSSFSNAKEPYDVKYVSATGLTAILEDNINVDNAPVWTTGAGNWCH